MGESLPVLLDRGSVRRAAQGWRGLEEIEYS
jgi:hypothetical protein